MTKLDAFRIRPAELVDAEVVARLHVAVWRQTYADLAPAAALEKLDEAHRLPGWQAALAPGAPGATLLAEVDGQAVGFVRYGAVSQLELGEAGEVKHLYILPGFARLGIGRALLAEAFAGLKALGFANAALAVVEGNASALAFYQALGGTLEGSFTDAGPIWRSHNLILCWVL